MSELARALRRVAPESHILTHEPMFRHTTFRIGGPADVALLPASGQEIAQAMALAAELSEPVTVVGNGSNLLVRDGGLRGLTIIIGDNMSRIRRDGNRLTAQAGASLARLAREAQAASLDGLAFAAGIPGSVGGGVAMNAGAYGGELKQALESVTVLEGGIVRQYAADALHMSYRNSDILRRGLIVLEATFALIPGDSQAILAQMNELARRRREKQPLSLPSAGSTFKRPEGHYAGALIQQAGLMGRRVGGAMVSDLHAGFIVNTGGATAADVLSLIQLVQKTVLETSGVLLEPEVRIIGEDA